MALSYYEKILQFQEKSLAPTHLNLTTTYKNIAGLNTSLGSK